MAQKKVSFHLKLDREVLEELRQVSKKDDVPVTTIITDAIIDELNSRQPQPLAY